MSDEDWRHVVGLPEFCEECGVSMDLHSGPDTCDLAERKAQLIERFPFGDYPVQ